MSESESMRGLFGRLFRHEVGHRGQCSRSRPQKKSSAVSNSALRLATALAALGENLPQLFHHAWRWFTAVCRHEKSKSSRKACDTEDQQPVRNDREHPTTKACLPSSKTKAVLDEAEEQETALTVEIFCEQRAMSEH